MTTKSSSNKGLEIVCAAKSILKHFVEFLNLKIVSKYLLLQNMNYSNIQINEVVAALS